MKFFSGYEKTSKKSSNLILFTHIELFLMLFLGLGSSVFAQPNTRERTNSVQGNETTITLTEEQSMAEHILYPSKYHPISEQGVEDALFQKASKILDSECADTCGHHSLYQSLIKGSQEQHQTLYDKVKGKNKQCQKALLNRAAHALSKEPFPTPCLNEENKTHPVCKNIIKNTDIIQARISKLINLTYGPEPLSDIEAKAPCLNCTLNTEGINDNPFENLIKSLEEQSQCPELNPGETKEIDSNADFNASYSLKQEEDGSYSITFPVNFYFDEDYDRPLSRPDYYMDKVQECLAEANQNMLGPNGEKLKIQIQEPPQRKNTKDKFNQTSQCQENQTATVDIAIGSENHRSNAQKYASDIDCPTITHEVLHLTGLCDEYQEKAYGFYRDPQTEEIAGSNFEKDNNEELNPSTYNFERAYDCRVISSNSIMSNHYERWENVKKGENKSLLTVGQFLKILYGNCPTKNNNFNKCSQLAYQSSQISKENCLEIKSQCESENMMEQNKQEKIETLQNRIKNLEQTNQDQLEFQKILQHTPFWNKTKRTWYNNNLANIDDLLQSEREALALAQSPQEKLQKETIITELNSQRDILLLQKRAQEEKGKGSLDKTFREAHEEKLNIVLDNIEVELQTLREQLEIVQSWPES